MSPPMPRNAFLVGLAGTLLLAAWGLVSVREAGAGWLAGFAFWISLPLGALALRAVHALTGGTWGVLVRPALDPVLAALPWFIPLGLPVLLLLPQIYPWAAEPALAAPGVAELYLNAPGFAVRSLIALGGWAILSLLLRRDRPAPLLAAFALVFHALAISAIPVDWLLSLAPRYVSSAFGAGIAMAGMLTALAWAALFGILPPGNTGRAGDVGAFLIAGILAVTYLLYMQYLVAWYGDLPDKAAWYAERSAWPWLGLTLLSLLGGALLPFLVLLRTRWRGAPAVLRRVAGGVLVGLAAYHLWLVLPPFGARAMVPGLLGLVAVGGLFVGLAGAGATLRARREVAHGA